MEGHVTESIILDLALVAAVLAVAPCSMADHTAINGAVRGCHEVTTPQLHRILCTHSEMCDLVLVHNASETRERVHKDARFL